MTPRDAVLARLEALALGPRLGDHKQAGVRLDATRPKSEPDVTDRVPGFLERQHGMSATDGWVPVDAIVTDRARYGWGGFDYRRHVVPSIWASAASVTTRELREQFLQRFGVVSVDEYVVGQRSIYVPSGDGHHRVGAAKLLELPFVPATVNETVSITSQLVVPEHFAEARLMHAVWEACFARGLTPWPPTVGGDGAVRVRVDPASVAPWVLLRPDQAASIGLAVQTHLPVVGLPVAEELASWRSWLRWLGVPESAVGRAPLQDPVDELEEVSWIRESLPSLPQSSP